MYGDVDPVVPYIFSQHVAQSGRTTADIEKITPPVTYQVVDKARDFREPEVRLSVLEIFPNPEFSFIVVFAGCMHGDS